MSHLLRSTLLAPLIAGTAWACMHLGSPAVRSARRPTLSARSAGPLFTRSGGTGRRGVLLLHGLVATGDVFAGSADLLARQSRVAVPDLLGFGRSLNESRTDFGTEAHLAALEIVIDEVLGDRPLLIGAHSMGSALALRLATRMPDRVERVVCAGAPMWIEPRAAVDAAGPMARALLLDERIAARVCAWNCRHREASGWLAAAVAPRWPIPISRQASLHTWPAYRQTMEDQVLDVDWSSLLASVARHDVPVTLAWGSGDRIGDPTYAQRLVEDLDGINVEFIPRTDHTAPIARPEWLATRLSTRPAPRIRVSSKGLSPAAKRE